MDFPKLVEVVAYLGGALVLAAATLFLATEWESLTFGARVGVLSVATVVLLVAGFVAARVPVGGRLLDPSYDVRRRLAGSLLSGAALTAAVLTGHLVDRALDRRLTRLDWVVLSAGAVALVVAGVGYVRAADRRRSPRHDGVVAHRRAHRDRRGRRRRVGAAARAT